ncbi:unnamed protein product [Malus baccata var. baccata]
MQCIQGLVEGVLRCIILIAFGDLQIYKTMSIVPICELKPLRNDMKIKVRICRMWRPKIFGRQNQFNGLQCVLVDELNDAIEASVLEADYERVAPKIKAGYIYEITQLHNRSNKRTFKVVPHTAQVFFNGKTTYKQITERPPHIPEHDVVGRITAVQPLEDKTHDQLQWQTSVCTSTDI